MAIFSVMEYCNFMLPLPTLGTSPAPTTVPRGRGWTPRTSARCGSIKWETEKSVESMEGCVNLTLSVIRGIHATLLIDQKGDWRFLVLQQFLKVRNREPWFLMGSWIEPEQELGNDSFSIPYTILIPVPIPPECAKMAQELESQFLKNQNCLSTSSFSDWHFLKCEAFIIDSCFSHKSLKISGQITSPKSKSGRESVIWLCK